MSEIEARHYCEVCKTERLHLFAGSGKKGICTYCLSKLPPDVKADLSKAASWSDKEKDEVIEDGV